VRALPPLARLDTPLAAQYVEEAEKGCFLSALPTSWLTLADRKCLTVGGKWLCLGGPSSRLLHVSSEKSTLPSTHFLKNGKMFKHVMCAASSPINYLYTERKAVIFQGQPYNTCHTFRCRPKPRTVMCGGRCEADPPPPPVTSRLTSGAGCHREDGGGGEPA
jgi:hypothetical protein